MVVDADEFLIPLSKEQKEKILRSLEANARQDASRRKKEIIRELAELGQILK